jgi:hypothetical protein
VGRSWVLPGHPANIARSLLDHRCCGGDRDYVLWAFRNQKDRDDLQPGDMVFFYATRPVKSIVAVGLVGEERFESNEPYWSIGGPWTYRFKVEPLIVCFNGDNVMGKWSSCRDKCKVEDCEECGELEEHYARLSQQLSVIAILVGGSRGQKVEIPEPLARWIVEVLGQSNLCRFLGVEGWVKGRIAAGEEEAGVGDLGELLILHLIAGKNVVVLGPPGSGKTKLVKDLCENLGVKCNIVTGNPEWTPFDTTGGYGVDGRFRAGFITSSVAECLKSLRSSGRPVFLIIDEINRANVDLAFGPLFTLLDLSHRDSPLLAIERGKVSDLSVLGEVLDGDRLYVPYSFRILATMNSYDRALLFKLGYALLRRFAVVEMRRDFRFEPNPEDWVNKAREWLNKYKVQCSLSNTVKLDLVERELLLSRPQLNDYALLDPIFRSELSSKRIKGVLEELATSGGFSSWDELWSIITSIACRINEKLVESNVEVTEAPLTDTIKFLVAATLLDKGWASKHIRALLDEALSSYVVPQLDILADRVRAERLGLMLEGGKGVKDRVEALSREMGDLGLTRTSTLLRRLAGGGSVL